MEPKTRGPSGPPCPTAACAWPPKTWICFIRPRPSAQGFTSTDENRASRPSAGRRRPPHLLRLERGELPVRQCRRAEPRPGSVKHPAGNDGKRSFRNEFTQRHERQGNEF